MKRREAFDQMIVSSGDMAKAFSLKDQHGNIVSLKDLLGKNILLSFHPLAWTRVCTEQMQSLEARREDFARLNTVPLGISIDHVPCKKAWAKSIKVEHTQLLCDFWPHGEVANLYGVFNKTTGASERANIIISGKHKVVFIKRYPVSQLPDIDEVIEELKKLG
jgi:peroxiredoxin